MGQVVYLQQTTIPATGAAPAMPTAVRQVRLLANLMSVAVTQTATAGEAVNEKIRHIEDCLDLIESRIDAIDDPLEQARLRRQGATVRLALRNSADRLSEAVNQLAQVKANVEEAGEYGGVAASG